MDLASRKNSLRNSLFRGANEVFMVNVMFYGNMVVLLFYG